MDTFSQKWPFKWISKFQRQTPSELNPRLSRMWMPPPPRGTPVQESDVFCIPFTCFQPICSDRLNRKMNKHAFSSLGLFLCLVMLPTHVSSEGMELYHRPGILLTIFKFYFININVFMFSYNESHFMEKLENEWKLVFRLPFWNWKYFFLFLFVCCFLFVLEYSISFTEKIIS